MKCIFSTKSQRNQFVKRIDDTQCNIYDHKEKTHTYKDQADGKNASKFLTDRTENKIIFDDWDRFR